MELEGSRPNGRPDAVTRRGLLQWLGRMALAGAAGGTYAFVIEPGFRLRTQYYAFTPPNWTPGLKLRLALLADPHLAEPYMPLHRWQKIVETANMLEADAILMLGDYAVGHNFVRRKVPAVDMASASAGLKAPLGVYAIMGNHDWWADRAAQQAGHGPTAGQKALEDAGIPVLENKAMRLIKDGLPFWFSGTASVIAIYKGPRHFEGRDDLPGTLAQITDSAPVIHLAHEPDQFVHVPERVSLTLSGHTHGGQVRILNYSPIVPSEYGRKYAYGHIVENGRHLVVSGGLGVSILPVRFGVPPEIVVLDLA
jgi:uncharacterized protein